MFVECLNDCRAFVCQCQQRSAHEHEILILMQFRGQPWTDQDLPVSHLWDILRTSTLDSRAILSTSWASGNLLSGSCWGSPDHINAPCLGHLGLIVDLSETKMQVILESSCTHQYSILGSSWADRGLVRN